MKTRLSSAVLPSLCEDAPRRQHELSELRDGDRKIGQTSEVFVGDVQVKLTARETSLTAMLVEAKGRVVSREAVEAKWEVHLSATAVDRHLKKPRALLRDLGVEIKNERGEGWRLLP